MIDISALEEAKEKAWQTYLIAKENLDKMKTAQDPAAFVLAAQAANDAWLQFKAMDKEVTNGLVLKKLGDLYVC